MSAATSGGFTPAHSAFLVSQPIVAGSATRHDFKVPKSISSSAIVIALAADHICILNFSRGIGSVIVSSIFDKEPGTGLPETVEIMGRNMLDVVRPQLWLIRERYFTGDQGQQ